MLIFLSGIVITNPLTYKIIESWSWRGSYVIYAGCVLVSGTVTVLTFGSVTEEQSHSSHNIKRHNTNEETYLINYTKKTDNIVSEKVKHEDNDLLGPTIGMKTKVLLSVIWFIASVLKALAYYAPFVTMVMYTHISIYKCGMYRILLFYCVDNKQKCQ